MHVCPSGVKGKHPFPGPPGKMIQWVIYKIPITKMDLESGAVCMNHLSQIIKNKALSKCSSKLVLSGVFNKSTRLFTWSSGELGMKKHSKSSPVLCKSLQSRPTLVTPWTVTGQAPLSMGFSREEYWSGLPCPALGDLPDPRIKPAFLMSPALAGGFFTACATWETLPPSRTDLNLPYKLKQGM